MLMHTIPTLAALAVLGTTTLSTRADLTTESSLPCGDIAYTVLGTDPSCTGCPHPARTVDFPITAQFVGLDAEVYLIGGDGGDVDIDCVGSFKVKGGQGAIAYFRISIGYGPGQLQPGGTLRAIVGKTGANEGDPGSGSSDFFQRSSDGGGGTALFYLPPGETWESGGVILGVGGGGGGATLGSSIFGFCTARHAGMDASLDANGIDGGGAARGGEGGSNGTHGTGGTDADDRCAGSGGWGIEGFPTSQRPDQVEWCVGFGAPGFGRGGYGPLSDVEERRGSGGGGGGGYSGGGGGAHKRAGGGGGSWINPDLTSNRNIWIDDDTYIEGQFSLRVFADDNNYYGTPRTFVAGEVLYGTACTSPAILWVPCASPTAWPEVYFQTTNSESCPIVLSFEWAADAETEMTFHRPGELGTPIGCGSGGEASIELLPGESIIVRVASNEDFYSIVTSSVVADADGDGVCNSEDQCPSGSDTTDCNANDLPDCLENLAFETIVRQDFDDAGGHPFTTTGVAYVTPTGIGRLTDTLGQIGTFIVEAPQLYEEERNWEATFDFRVGDEIPGGEGVSLALYSLFDEPTPDFRVDSKGESPDTNEIPIALVSFDTHMGEGDLSDNFLRFAGPSGASGGVPVTYDMDDGRWYRAVVRFESAGDFQPCFLSVSITPVDGGATETILDQHNVGSGFLSPAWFAFGASTTITGRNTRIDNVSITDFVHGDDCDGDGIPNGCDTAGCEAPLNDDCASAVTVGLGFIDYDTSNATIGSLSDQVAGSDLRDVWFRYVPTCDVRLHASMTAIPGACSQPSIWTGCGGTLLSGNFCQDAVADLTAGEAVLIRVAYFNGAGGTGTLELWTDEPDADGDTIPDYCDNCPYIANVDQLDLDGNGVGDVCEVVNDDCASPREVLFSGGSGGIATVAYDCRVATDTEPFGSCFSLSGWAHDLWYSVTASADGPVTFWDPVFTANADAMLTVYDACDGNPLACTVTTGPAFIVQAFRGQELLVRIASKVAPIPGSGTFTVSLNDADLDGVTDEFDVCPGSPDEEDSDGDGIPDGCDTSGEDPCPFDLDDNGIIDAADLALVLGAWGTKSSVADTDGNGIVDAADLAIILGFWGACP